MIFGKAGNSENTELELTTESSSLIMECVLQEALAPNELEAFLENSSEVNAALRENILLERSIVKLDKKAKFSRAQKMAAFTIAKEKNDRDFKKLLTVWKMERFLESKILKRYQGQSNIRARQAMQNAGRSKSAIIKKVANQVHSQLNGSVIGKK